MPAAAQALAESAFAGHVAVTGDGLTVTLPGSAREQTAETGERLEDWFLSVTSRFGGQQ